MAATQEQAAQRMLDAFMNVRGTVSVSLVGSFWSHRRAGDCGDIDVVVIGRRLDRTFFDHCLRTAEALTPHDLGLSAGALRVNASFGPLKFDTPGTAVLHLMVYDQAGHREHVLKSPFTCYDWELSRRHAGPSLAEIYPVFKLQPRDFTSARRGLADYLADLHAGVITYREYAFDGERPLTRVARHPLDERHRGEFACHIIRNLVLNYLKLMRRSNLSLSTDELVAEWERHLPACAAFIPAFRTLAAAKERRPSVFPPDALETTTRFVETFDRAVRAAWDHQPTLAFVRHAATALNDGTFLGQRRDPPILAPETVPAIIADAGTLFAGRLRRTRETAARLAPGVPIVTDGRLDEIDYGHAEGLSRSELAAHFPDLIAAWERGEDPRFPDGENQRDVLARLNAFIGDIGARPGTTAAVTHNVVMRSLAGQHYDIPMRDWFKIRIPHLERFDYRRYDGQLYPDLSPAAKAAVTDSLRPWVTHDHE